MLYDTGYMRTRRGFSIIELLISMAILVVVAAIGIIAFNPAKQFAGARNSKRMTDLNSILVAVQQNIADTNQAGVFSCGAGDIPTTTKRMANGTGNYDIAPCLISTYLSSLPFDSSTSSAHYTSASDYNTGYNILRSVVGTSTQIIISAPAAELGKTISVTR